MLQSNIHNLLCNNSFADGELVVGGYCLTFYAEEGFLDDLAVLVVVTLLFGEAPAEYDAEEVEEFAVELDLAVVTEAALVAGVRGALDEVENDLWSGHG